MIGDFDGDWVVHLSNEYSELINYLKKQRDKKSKFKFSGEEIQKKIHQMKKKHMESVWFHVIGKKPHSQYSKDNCCCYQDILFMIVGTCYYGLCAHKIYKNVWKCLPFLLVWKFDGHSSWDLGN